MHIEQSRYGTGDPISFFLMMLLIYFASLGIESPKHQLSCVFFCFFISGMLAAVKYPLIFFCVIPIYASIVVMRNNSQIRSSLIYIYISLYSHSLSWIRIYIS